jgi:molybdopterin-guanine dinucleotide biosynthesis protein A
MSQSDRVQTSVYFPKDVYDVLVKWAEEEDRPISNLVVRIVSKAVEVREKQQKPPQP